jgi:hypothetical protein
MVCTLQTTLLLAWRRKTAGIKTKHEVTDAKQDGGRGR